MNIDPKQALANAANAYSPAKGWRTVAQPVGNCRVQEYCELATEAHPVLERELVAFCEKNRFSYAIIPHSDFKDLYEARSQNFQSWYEGACQRHRQNKHADVMIITCTKEFESAERKNQFNPQGADRVKDYLRAMGVFLHGNTAKSKRQSLDNLGSGIDAMENDERTVARNNLFWKPKDNGFRAYKSAWEIDLPPASEFSGLSVLASIKLQHQDQMDIDRLTRKLIHRERDAINALKQYSCNLGQDVDPKSAGAHMKRLQRGIDLLTDVDRALYDSIHAPTGFNRFLNPELVGQHSPKPPQDVLRLVQQVVSKNPGMKFEDFNTPTILGHVFQGRSATAEHLKLVK